MTLEKLTIVPEKKGGALKPLEFDTGNAVKVKFNPNRLAFSKSVNWENQNTKGHDNPELQWTNSQPRTLAVDLLFDTYDAPGTKKDDVRLQMTWLLLLTTVDGDKHRPPVCRLTWGAHNYFFQGVLRQLEQTFTLFVEGGTPVRATAKCTFMEWRTNYDDLNHPDRQSSDIAKERVLRRGDSLASIAAKEYRDPRKWRPIALANQIEDPLTIPPGIAVRVPVLED